MARFDVDVYNEATGFLFTSRAIGGSGLDSGDAAWDEAVQRGDLLPIELVQDDSFVVRVVVGEDLRADEQEQWVGRVAAKLNVPDGRLAISAGIEFVMEPLDEGVSGESEYVRIVDVPARTYSATVYAYLHGVNGEHMLGLAAPAGKKAEPVGAYFRRTRPGEAFPPWLRSWCIAYPDKDPGHQREWQGSSAETDGPPYVDFLLHLLPLDVEPASPPLEQGFVAWNTFEARKPERCPIGIEARDLLKRPEPPRPEPPPRRPPDLLARAASHPPVAVAGGPVALPIERIVQAYELAWFATDSADAEIRIEPPSGAAVDVAVEDIEDLAVERAGAMWRAGVEGGGGKWPVIKALRQLGPRLAGLPDESVVELITAVQHPDDEDPLLGLMRLRGRISAGVWQVDEAFPEVAAARLRDALALAAQADDDTSLVLADAGEAATVLERFMKEFDFLVEDNPVRQEDGTLRLGKPDRPVVAFLACEAFRLRYADTWTMPAPSEPFDLAGIFAAAAGLKGHDQGAVILEGDGKRQYRSYDLRSLGERARARADEADRALAALGYQPLGDLVCSAFSDIAVRGYARPAGDTWAALLHGRFGQESFDFVTTFAKGAALTTTIAPGSGDDKAKKNFKTSHPRADLATLHRHHEKRKAELAGAYGAPVATQADLASFARAVEQGVARERSK